MNFKTILLIKAALFLLAASFTSCKGQVETERPKEKVGVPLAKTISHPKLLKTLGSNKYANVHCGLQDKGGNFWFGTTGEGVYYYDGKGFTQYTIKDGLSSNVIWSAFEDKAGNIWFGTDSGACRYDGKNITPVQMVVGGGNVYANSINPHHSNNVWSIMQDKSGILWFATTKGVYCYDGTSFTRFLDNDSVINNTGLRLKNVEYILEDKDGKIWMGGRGNAGVFQYDGRSLSNLKPDGERWVWPVLEDKSGNIWCTNWSGAFSINGKTITSYTKKEGLCSNNITRLIEDRNGDLWFGSDSDDGGMCRFDGRSFTHFSVNGDPPNNSIWTILEAKNGDLWVGTRNTGLYRFDGKTFMSFTE